MKKLYVAAFMAVLFCLFAISPRALAAPVQIITSGGDFAVASAVEVPGTYPPVVYLYGGSSRAGFSYTEFGVLTSSDGFTTSPTWQAMTGVAGYAGTLGNSAIVTCPAGKTCGGYKAFYVIDSSPATLYRCTGLAGVKDLSGCVSWSVPGLFDYVRGGIGLDQTGDKLLVGALNDNGGAPDDTKSQIHSIDIATSTATKLTACSDPSQDSSPNGSIAGDGVNQYFYLNYSNLAHYRYTWNGSTCTGGRALVNGVMGWDNGVNSVDTDDYGAVGQLTGTFYLSLADGTFKISKKDANCGDSFMSLGSAEKCDPNNLLHPLNDQTCTSIGMGFTGGALACNPGTCLWNTSSCTSPAVCGNGTKEGPEVCDAPDFGGKSCSSEVGAGWTGSLTCTSCTTIGTGSCVPPPPVCGNGTKEGAEACDAPDYGGKSCSSEMGAGWTGSLTCTSCTTIGTGSCVAPPPTCGDLSCNGSETCASCPSDCGVCCGNSAIDAGEQCDGSTMGGASCSSVLGGGYTGSLTCKGNCTFETGACTPPVTCGNGMLDFGEQCDGSNMGGKTCDSEMGVGWTGSLSCSSCMVVTSACAFNWGLKNLSGSCSKGAAGAGGASQMVNFDGGSCSGEYWPIGAVTGSQIKWIGAAGKVLAITVVPTGSATNVATPQGVSHEDIVDNGNKYQANAGNIEASVEGTDYLQMEKAYPIYAYECSDGRIRLKFEGTWIAAINVDGTAGRLPAGYGVEVNVLTGEVTKAPYKIGSTGDGGAGGGDGGSGGDGGAGGETSVGPGPTGGGDGGDSEGCSCAVPGKEGFDASLIMVMAMVAFAAARRRKS